MIILNAKNKENTLDEAKDRVSIIVNSYIADVGSFECGEGVEIGNYNRIGKNVTIGAGSKIGHHCIIDDDVTIGKNVVIENFVLLKKYTIIGDESFIDSYVRSSGSCKIGNRVTVRYGATIAKKVTIENDAFISPNVMTIYSTHEGIGVPGTLIGAKAHIGTAAVLGPGIKIAPSVVIGAMAYVSKNCSEKGVYVGVPAKKIKDI
jgi:acetyltransferase-like isoleucine patch superfamily enzyme